MGDPLVDAVSDCYKLKGDCCPQCGHHTFSVVVAPTVYNVDLKSNSSQVDWYRNSPGVDIQGAACNKCGHKLEEVE